MRRYVIVLIALMVAILVMSLIKSWQKQQAIKRGEDPEATNGISVAHLWGAITGLAVFFLGVVLLETTASRPEGAYQPAQIQDGKITSGTFTTDDQQTN